MRPYETQELNYADVATCLACSVRCGGIGPMVQHRLGSCIVPDDRRLNWDRQVPRQAVEDRFDSVRRGVQFCDRIHGLAGADRSDGRSRITLIYEVKSLGEGEEVDVAAIVRSLSRRVNSMNEVVVGPLDANQVEIIAIDLTQDEIAALKRRLEVSGTLSFYIVANPADPDHREAIDLAREQKETARWVYYDVEADSRMRVAMWAKVVRVDKVWQDITRDAKTKEWIDTGDDIGELGINDNDGPIKFEGWLEDHRIDSVEVLMFTDEVQVSGNDLAATRSDVDQQGNPSISFKVKPSRAKNMAQLTGSNLPDGTLTNRLGILLDEQLLSAPTIRSTITTDGQITGEFTQEEVNVLVDILRAGRLPGMLQTPPLSETIESEERPKSRGVLIAIVISLGVVLVFMAVATFSRGRRDVNKDRRDSSK